MIEPLAQVFTPERPFSTAEPYWTDSVFLAGTIEMGNSVDWQAKAIRRLQGMPINIFNPRRVVPPDEKLIAEQINWELDSIASCRFIYMYLAGCSISPISLYELGLLQGSKAVGRHVVLCCDPEYTRKDNVLVTTSHPFFANPNIYLTHSFEGSLLKLKELISGQFTN